MLFKILWASALILPLCAEEVRINRYVEIDELASGAEVSLGRFDLNQLDQSAADFRVMVDYRSVAFEEVKNPAGEDFEFQFWFDSQVFIVGRQNGEVVFELSSDQYEVVDTFETVPAESEVLLGFADSRVFERSVEDVSSFAGGEIELFLRLQQTLSGGTAPLSELKDYEAVEIGVTLGFSTEKAPEPSPSLVLNADLKGAGDGVMNFLTRQGFRYQIFQAETVDAPVVILDVEGTGTDLTYTLAELNVNVPRAIFWLEEIPLEGGGD